MFAMKKKEISMFQNKEKKTSVAQNIKFHPVSFDSI